MIFGPAWSIPFVWSTKTMCAVVFEFERNISIIIIREKKRIRVHLCVFLENWSQTSRWWIYYFRTSLQRSTDKIANLGNLYAKHQKRSKWKEKLCDLTHTLRPKNYDFHLFFGHLHKDINHQDWKTGEEPPSKWSIFHLV